MKKKSFLFVFLQFAGILFLLGTGPVFPKNVGSVILFLSGIIIGCWAVLVMTSSRLSVFPDVLPRSKFIRKGPYRYIRHPMYLSVILACFSFLMNDFSWIRMIIFVLLILTLLFKISYEEILLVKVFPEYITYMNKTGKLIPFIY